MDEKYSSFPKYKVDNEIELDKIVCRFYADGNCPDKKCIFPHINDGRRIRDTACRYFLQGKCNYGKMCAFDHVGLVERRGLRVLKIIECQFKERRRLIESMESKQLSLSDKSNLEQGAPLTKSCLKTQSNLNDELFYSEREKRQQNQFGASCLPTKDLEIHKTEQNPCPRLRSPKKKIELPKLSRTAFPPLPERQPCVHGPLGNRLPEKTADYKNLIPTQVFKSAIANDQRIGCGSWRNSQAAATHKFSENLPCYDDFNISRPEKPQNLMTSFNEEHQFYPQSSSFEKITPVVDPQEKASSSKRKQLVSQQIIENAAKQKQEFENSFLIKYFQKLPYEDEENPGNLQHLKETCTDILKFCFGRDGVISPSTSNMPLQGRKTFHEDFNLPTQSSSTLPPYLRSSEICQHARQISSNLSQLSEERNRVQPSASNVPAQGGKIFHEGPYFPGKSSTHVPLYLRSSKSSEPSKKNSSVAKKKRDVQVVEQNVVTSQPTTPFSYRRSFKPSRKEHDN